MSKKSSIIAIAAFTLVTAGALTFSHVNLKDQADNLSGAAQGGNSLTTGTFSQVLVATDLANPTALAFAPDGRLFVTLQTGQIRVIKNGVLLPTPFATISVNSSGERGLNGIAFDPNFATNNYIYVYYTLPSASNNRVSRFTASGDVAVAGSETVLLNLDPLSSASNHNGGALAFGTDGKLYIGVGDSAQSANAQNMETNLAKILRINKDGTIPTDNPYTTGSAQHRQIWASGMRNPFTIAVQQSTGKVFANDVGAQSWEEVNDVTVGGKNFGWPSNEGVTNNPLYTDPLYAYGHGSGTSIGCAITGGTFFNPTTTNYPAEYVGKYFFFDYCNNWMDTLDLSGTLPVKTNFMTGVAAYPTNLTVGPDGNLYLLSRGIGQVYKITYSTTGVPSITTGPQNATVAAGNSAIFSVTAVGTAPLTYQWKKNGASIPNATNQTYTISSATSSDAGTYSVTVSNSAGSANSAGAILTVTSPNQSPTASITIPTTGTTYVAGTTLSFSGDGTDPEDGTLPSSAFAWSVLFYHSDLGATHTHPGPTLSGSGKNGSFVIPNTGETSTNVWYRLSLVVTDSLGATNTTYVDILPRTSTMTFQTSPTGNQITLDGQPFSTPYTTTSVEGVLRTLGVTIPSGYTFSSWSQGGSQNQTVATPTNDTTYTATLSNTVTPTISIVTPVATSISGNPVSGTVPITVTTTGPITTVKYYKYFDNKLFATSTTPPSFMYNWNTSATASSVNTLIARGYDANGNLIASSKTVKVTISNPVLVACNDTVDNDADGFIDMNDQGCSSSTDTSEINTDTTAPTVSLSAPSGTVSGVVSLSATAYDAVGVSKVEFYRGTTKMGEDTSSPYSYAWNTTTVPNGTYSLSAKAYDAAGNVGTSASMNVTVNNIPTSNNAPVVFAGYDNSASVLSFNMYGSVTDSDGPAPLTILWTKVSGPGTVTMENPASPTSKVTFSVAGTYVLRLTATDGAGKSAYDDVLEVVGNPS